jgi:anti-anti-sigma regulatory factor
MISTRFLQQKSLNFDNVRQEFKELKKWLSTQKTNDLALDLSLIEYIDSAGIAMLIELRKIAQFKYHKSIQMKISPIIHEMLMFYDVEQLLGKVE